MGVIAAALLLCLVTLGAHAQEARRPFRIGILNEAWSAEHPTIEGLKAGLKDLGLEDGRDVTFDIRFTEGKRDVMPAVAAALIGSGVDLIFASHEAAVRAAARATRDIPIVFTSVGDAVGAGIVAMNAEPGGNVTGVSSLQTELVAKRLQILTTLAPAVRRVFLVYDRAEAGAAVRVDRAREAAPGLNVEVVARAVDSPGELQRVFAEIRPADALLAPEESNLAIPLAILEQSLALRIPAMFATALWVGHGGLVSYGPDYYAAGVQAASLVARIRAGARPRDLPVEGADRIDLAVNLKTAEIFGLDIPRKILLRADAFRR